MIPLSKLFTSGIGEQWHKCTDEARSLADDMKDEISKRMMLQIADDYEHSQSVPNSGRSFSRRARPTPTAFGLGKSAQPAALGWDGRDRLTR